jgi:hypothetical protein
MYGLVPFKYITANFDGILCMLDKLMITSQVTITCNVHMGSVFSVNYGLTRTACFFAPRKQTMHRRRLAQAIYIDLQQKLSRRRA